MNWSSHVIVASGISRGHVRTMATTVESRNMAAILQRLTETCSLGLPCTFLIYDIMLRSIDTCQINLSADQYHVTISWAQVYSSSRSHVLLKLTADQVLVFNWIAGSCQVDLLKREPGLKVNQIITVSSLQMFFVYSFCFVYRFCDFLTQYRRPNNTKKTPPQSYKTQINLGWNKLT